ncbi:MAG: hypothetical protein WC683_03935 [bacterium]
MAKAGNVQPPEADDEEDVVQEAPKAKRKGPLTEGERIVRQNALDARVSELKAESVARHSVNPGDEKITKEMVPYIETRLSLSGGTLPVEIGADLANRFGVSKLDAAALDKGITRQEPTHRAALVAGFTRAALKWIEGEYGQPVKDGMGRLVGYGERIAALPNGHLQKRF